MCEVFCDHAKILYSTESLRIYLQHEISWSTATKRRHFMCVLFGTAIDVVASLYV